MTAAVATTRFGLGARPGEIARIGDPQAWLAAQIRPEGADQPQGALRSTAEQLAAQREAYRERRRADREAPEGDVDARVAAQQRFRRSLIEAAAGDFLARVRLGCATEAGFRERWTLFWCNWFTVSAAKGAQVATLVGPFEREAIRPRVFGRFEDLARAAVLHPAMLVYLDQANAVGPDSPAGRRSGRGLNENLAREALELHTVGADAGYGQTDVTEFARALTGWTVHPRTNVTIFAPARHEPGARRVMGRLHPASGEAQAPAILADLARRPQTARRVARGLAIHFVADDPPPALVARLERAFVQSDGRLDAVARALIAAPEAWAPEPRKLKTPYEFVVSSLRAVGAVPATVDRIGPALTALGQRPFAPPSPKGWPDEGEAWASAAALGARMRWAETFARAAAPRDREPLAVARDLLGERVGRKTLAALERADDPRSAFAVLLMSPEFQRR